ncbi:MAG: hypothetical protein WCG67_10460, partial [Ferruginibacter sp.]
MKYLKFVLLNIIVFGSLFTGISLLFPSVIHTSKTINIASPQNVIITKLSDVHSWKDWNSFALLGSVRDVTTTTNTDAVSTTWDFNEGRNLQCELLVYQSSGDSTPVSFVVTEK